MFASGKKDKKKESLKSNKEGNSLLFKAVENKDSKQLRDLIARGANVNLENKYGDTPLKRAACLNGEKGTALIAILLQHKADANQYHGDSPLSCAVQKGNSKSVALLLPYTEKKEVIRRNQWDGTRTGLNPWYVDLMFKAIHNKENIKILSLLKANGADFNDKNDYGDTLLNIAVRALSPFKNRNDCGYRSDVMNKTVDNCINETQEYFNKAFKLIKFLVKNGADISLGDRDGNTPLHVFIKEVNLQHSLEEHAKVLQFFAKRNANVNAQTIDGITPLHQAVSTGNYIAITFLVKKSGASIDPIEYTYQRTPLHLAAAKGFAQAAGLLIRLGANDKVKDINGLTPLQLCKAVYQHEKKKNDFFPINPVNKIDERYLETQRIIALSPQLSHGAMTEFMKRQRFHSTPYVTRTEASEADQDKIVLFYND